MTTFKGSEGTIEVSTNHTQADSPEDAIFINTNRTQNYGSEYVTVSVETARKVIEAIQESIDRFEATKPKPKPKPTRTEIIRGYAPGTVFETGNYYKERWVRLAGDEVFKVDTARTVPIGSWFSDAFGTHDLKVVSK